MSAGTGNTLRGATQADWIHADLVLGLGADLLPIAPADSEPAPNSTVKTFGKVPSALDEQGRAYGLKGWQSRVIAPQMLDVWSSDPRLSICVRAGAVRAIDVDVTDAGLAAEIRGVLPKSFPLRTRLNSSKFLMPFRLATPLKKRIIETARGRIEALGNGQQWLLSGAHPSGVRYEWDGARLPDDIPAVTAEQFEALWAALERFSVKPALSSASSSAPSVADESSTVLKEISESQLQDLRSALAWPALQEAAADNSVWSEAGLSLLSLGTLGRDLWIEFSRNAAGYEAGAPETWLAQHATQVPRSDWRHVMTMARKLGWGKEPAPVETFKDYSTSGSAIEASQPGAATERFKLIPAHEFAAGPPLQYIVDGVLPRTPFGMVFGRTGAGKTFFVLDLVCAIARGEPWRGKAVKQADVAYICAEGQSGFKKRLRAYEQHHNVKLEDIPLTVIADVPNLRELGDCVELIEKLRAHGSVGVVVIDTLAATTPGANENSGEDMGPVLERCRAIHVATGAVVLLIHHCGKDETRGARGWSGIKAAAEFEIEVTREFDDRYATATKERDEEDGAKFPFKLRRITLPTPHGAQGLDALVTAKPLTSCVVEHLSTDNTTQRGRDQHLGKHESLVLSVLRQIVKPGLNSGAAVDDVLTAAVVKMPFDSQKRDRRREVARRALDVLIERHLIVCENNTVFFPLNADSPAPGTDWESLGFKDHVESAARSAGHYKNKDNSIHEHEHEGSRGNGI